MSLESECFYYYHINIVYYEWLKLMYNCKFFTSVFITTWTQFLVVLHRIYIYYFHESLLTFCAIAHVIYALSEQLSSPYISALLSEIKLLYLPHFRFHLLFIAFIINKISLNIPVTVTVKISLPIRSTKSEAVSCGKEPGWEPLRPTFPGTGRSVEADLASPRATTDLPLPTATRLKVDGGAK